MQTIGDDSVETVRDLFEQHRFHHLLVVEHGKLLGVISDRDLLRNLSPFVGKDYTERQQDLATLQRRAHQIMTRKMVTTESGISITDAGRLMVEHSISCLPIVDDKMNPKGIVTTRDLLRALVLRG
jgi:acetoin utilization protein AcuB